MKGLEHDDDSDVIVPRRKNECIEIGMLIMNLKLSKMTISQNLFLEHKKSTVLSEVGLQVWRGAFLLNDFILSNRNKFSNKKILELGSGVGLTSILASTYAKRVICTGLWKEFSSDFIELILSFEDINIGGILDLIRRNVELNKSNQRYPKNIEVMELDFLAKTFSVRLEDELKTVDIALAADGIIDPIQLNIDNP